MSLWHCKAHFKLWQSSHISPPCTGIWVWFLGCTTYQPIAGVFVFEKLSEITSQNYGEKENLSVHIYLICIMKNTQQLLWLGFCLKETLRSVGSLRNTRKQVKSIFFFFSGRETEKKLLNSDTTFRYLLPRNEGGWHCYLQQENQIWFRTANEIFMLP